jgi:hypothetical protein
MGTFWSVWLGNDRTRGLALVYEGTSGSVLYFQWLQWLVMELEIGTWGYLWVCVGTYDGSGLICEGPCGVRMPPTLAEISNYGQDFQLQRFCSQLFG